MVFEENILRLIVTVRSHREKKKEKKNEYFANVNFLIRLFSQEVIITLLQNKFTLHLYF